MTLVDKVAAGFERIDFNFEGSMVDKMLSNSITCLENTFVKGKVS